MPEGPEVKTVARTLANEVIGKKLGKLWHSPFRLRQTVDYAKFESLYDKCIDGVFSYGKMLFVDVDKKPAFMAQLGMTGQLIVSPIDAPVAAHTHVRWPFKHSDCELRYVDPRRFGLFDVCDQARKQACIEKLGPDPFFMTDQDISPLILVMKRSQRAIKEILLDQTVIAGVGNIYASESLFLANIHPERRGIEISDNEYRRLISAVIQVLHIAYENSGTTFSNYVDGSGQKGKNQQFLKVFQRPGEPCFHCSSLIMRIKQGGRASFYCPLCQK